MSTVAAILLMAAVTFYAIFGGADFGAGFWDLTAGGADRGKRPREVIDHSIGPVWEANHVWLIFVFVLLWTCFPEAYASILLTMFVPLTVAAFGIVLRGASFAFRKAVFRVRAQRHFGAIFAISSVLVPYCFGAVAGGIASGRVPAGGQAGDPWNSWVNPTSIVVGVLAVCVTAYVAAVFLTWDAGRLADDAMVSVLPHPGRGSGRRSWSPCRCRPVRDAQRCEVRLRRTHLARAPSGCGLGDCGACRARTASGAATSRGAGGSRGCGWGARLRMGSCPVGLLATRDADGIAGWSAGRNDNGGACGGCSRCALDRARVRLVVHARPKEPTSRGRSRGGARSGKRVACP